MVLKYYFNFLSQPSRSLYIFLKLNKIAFEACPVALEKGEHLTDEFKEQFNRFQKVPFIHDADFKLAESIGIFRYLTREYAVEDHWYPRESKRQAKIDEYLEWHHLNLRFHCSSYFFAKWLNPLLRGTEPRAEKIQLLERNMRECLDKFEEYFLKDSPFVNSQQVSFADLLAACEIEQTRIAGFEPEKNKEKLAAWLERVRTACNPYYDEAHAISNKISREVKLQAKL